MAEILIVDDDPQLVEGFEKLLRHNGYAVRTASSGRSAIHAVEVVVPDLVVMAVRMSGMSGLEAFAAIRTFAPHLPVVIMTAYGTMETAIEATRMGAFDYILKPFDDREILDLVERGLKAGRRAAEQVELGPDPESATAGALVGKSRKMNEVYKAIGRVALTDALVLIRGESGTGKELVARAVFQYSERADKPLQIINCVAIPETLLESELFGHERGAFTGATHRRPGKIERANGGTVFLDEIGDMPLPVQAKVLRLLEERQIERLGGGEPVPVDVRIVAATNRDLEAAVAEGRFREDLYYRLNVVTITLPPLRERGDDVLLLTEYFLKRMSRELDTPNPGLSPDGARFLMTHTWPGNVRELSNLVLKTLILGRGLPLGRDELVLAIGESPSSPESPGRTGEDAYRSMVKAELMKHGGGHVLEMLMNRAGRTIISEALALTDGNKTHAAKLLGLSRPTLLARMEKYGLKNGW